MLGIVVDVDVWIWERQPRSARVCVWKVEEGGGEGSSTEAVGQDADSGFEFYTHFPGPPKRPENWARWVGDG